MSVITQFIVTDASIKGSVGFIREYLNEGTGIEGQAGTHQEFALAFRNYVEDALSNNTCLDNGGYTIITWKDEAAAEAYCSYMSDLFEKNNVDALFEIVSGDAKIKENYTKYVKKWEADYINLGWKEKV